MSNYKSAKDIASNEVYYIDGLATVDEAIQMMKSKNVDFLFIQKRNEADANGIVVISDIIRGVISRDLKPSEVSVYEIMTKPAISIPASLNCKYVSRFLINAKINAAPVEENGTYMGAIHLRDIVFNL